MAALCDHEKTFSTKFILYSNCHCRNIQSLFILFLHRWSYGVVLYEIFTIGNILSIQFFERLHSSGKAETEISQKIKYCKKKWRKETRVVGMFHFECKCSPTIPWKYGIHGFLFFKQLLQIAFNRSSDCALRASFINSFSYSVCDEGDSHIVERSRGLTDKLETLLLFYIGGSPYPRMDGRKIASLLQEGKRMPKPQHVDDKL